MKRILEEVTSAVLVLLLLVKFATSADVVVITNSSDWYESPESSAAQNNTRTNDERYNESGQQEQPSNATENAISLQQKKDARIRLIRDRERWTFILLMRVWELSGRPTTANSLDSVDLGSFESLLEEGNGRNDREPSELTTYVYLSQCSGPHNFVGEWNDSTNFRLYFKMESLETSYRLREITVNSAFLCIKKSPLVFGNHRPALTSARTGRQRVTGSDAGSRSSGRASSLRRRPTRDKEIPASSSNVSSSSPSSSSSSPTFSRSDPGGGAIINLKIVVNSFSRNRKNRQEMRPVAVTPVSRQSTEWIRINLTQVVDDWLKRPSRNLGLQVTLRSSASPSSSELNPDDYFEGTNCSITASTGQSSPIHLWSPGDSVGQSSAHLENINHPFLEVVTVQVSRSRLKHRRHVKSDHRFEVPSHEVDRDKSSTLGKWIQGLRSSDAESSSSQTQHLPPASDSVFPLVEQKSYYGQM